MNSKYKVGDVVHFYDLTDRKILSGVVKDIEFNGDDDHIYTCIIHDNSLCYIWETELEYIPVYLKELLVI